MLIPGLVSVTFRQLSPEEIAREASAAGLRAIEWGGDLHAPAGQPARARNLREITTAAGLETVAYGSYFRLAAGQDVRPSLEIAELLAAPTMRIWSGERASKETSDAEFGRIADELRFVCELAHLSGRTISLEFHEDTLTDGVDAVRRLVELVGHPALRSYWQPLRGATSLADPSTEIAALQPWLSNLHVFNRNSVSRQWEALAEALVKWREPLRSLSLSLCTHAVLIEFVRDGSIESFREDAAALRSLLHELSANTP